MHATTRPRVRNFVSLLTAAVVSATFAAAPTAPTTPPPPASAPAGTLASAAPALLKAGQTLSLDDLFTNYAERFDIIFVKSGAMTDSVTLPSDVPADAISAISVLNDALSQHNLTTWRVRRNPSPNEQPSGRILLQVLTINEAREKQRQESPVTSGTDPSQINMDERDRIVTHIVPITNPQLLDAARRAAATEKDVTVTVIGGADASQLVLTGPALNVRRALTAVITVDKPAAKISPVTRSLHVENIDAEQAAATVNQLNGPNVLGDKAVHAVADKRTNTVIMTGPEAQVLRAMGDLTLQDQGPLPPPAPMPVPAPGVAPPVEPQKPGASAVPARGILRNPVQNRLLPAIAIIETASSGIPLSCDSSA